MHKLFQNRIRLRGALSLLLCAALLVACGWTGRARAFDERQGSVTLGGGTLNVRDAAGGTRIGGLANGDAVTIADRVTDGSGGSWYKIAFAGGPDGYGYASAAYITITPDASAAALSDTVATVTVSSLDVWSFTDTTYGKITTLGQNSVVTLKYSLTAGETNWYYIKTASGLYGYCDAASVTVTAQLPQGSTKDDYLAHLTSLGFPASYQEALWELHQLYPTWEFRAFATGVDWSSAVEEEYVLGKSLVSDSSISSWKSTQDGAYNWTDSTWNVLDSGGWVAASRELIAHYMDPRNSLDASGVFQFLYQGYDAATQTEAGLTAMVAGTFLADAARDLDGDGSNGVNTYVNTLYAAGSAYGVSPYVLASMMIMEMGASGASDSISGTSSRFPGYYNAFNLGAFKDRDFTAVERGLWYASGGNSGGTSYGRPWDTLYKAVLGGARYYAENFVGNGQNTLYLKRFNVQGNNMYSNQYMTNVSGASSEGRILAKAYSETMRAAALVFNIPVYNGMPESACAMPTGDGSPNTKLESLTVTGGALSPAFGRDVTAYTLSVPNTTSAVTVTAAALSGSATVTGTGTVNLAVGANTVTVTVTAGNGSTGTYTIAVTRQEAAGPVSFTGTCGITAEGRVTGVAPGTTADGLLAALGVSGGTSEVAGKSGAAPVGTGDVVNVYYDDAAGTHTLYGSYTVLIYGDVNGDGAIKITDLIKIRNQLLGTGILTDAYYAAADVNRNGSVQITDLIKVRNHILGTGSIQQ